ncbi:hypothetical protein NA57DRAFT_14112, partial [Rhizodiscina lignyota]
GDAPPIYTIDLSLPPAERYVELAQAFKADIQGLTGLFDDVVGSLYPDISITTIRRLAKVFLRRLHSKEQTEEIRGISRVTGVEMYLLVCFNTLLDMLMGCSSGGIRSECSDGEVRMLHFRTLDWGMDSLRKIVVQLEFVDRPHGRVLARSITYVGFVGVLTGVRPALGAQEGLSLSLNFRPRHNDSDSRLANLRYYGNHVLVLLGLRPSISSRLRGFILPPAMRRSLESSGHKDEALPDLAKLTKDLPSATTTAAYIIASNGAVTTVFEKDRATALIRSSSSFVIATNHDLMFEPSPESQPPISSPHTQETAVLTDLQDLLDESIDRKQCMEARWKKAVRRFGKKHPGTTDEDVFVGIEDVVRWVRRWPVTNECTHFACVMDPVEGEILWVRRWMEP